MNEQLSLNNFFFSCFHDVGISAVKSLATINVGVGQGMSTKRILPIIDNKNLLMNKISQIDFKNGDIEFKDINFNYSSNQKKKIKKINIKISGKK